MIYYAHQESFEKRGMDYDLVACLETHPQPGFDLLEIDKVLAVEEGQNDGPNWHWILRLIDGRYVYLTGGCDYTGWDCQSHADSYFIPSPEAAIPLVQEKQDYYRDSRDVAARLLQQIPEGKKLTWRETMDKELKE